MKNRKKETLKFALKKSIPVLFGYVFLGMAFGIVLYETGYNFLWAILISSIVFAGSGQFLLCSLISANSPLTTVAFMTLFLNSRHMFYGLSYVETFKKGKLKYPYMIFSLTDETYCVNTSFTTTPPEVDEVDARFYIGLFNQIYWILGSIIGSLAGQLIPINFNGIDFSMTALFVVVFIDQIIDNKNNKLSGAIGIVVALVSLIIFGADNFLLPTLIITLALMLAIKPTIKKLEAKNG